MKKVEKQLLERQTRGQMGKKRAVQRTHAECKHKRTQSSQLIWSSANFFKLHLDARQIGSFACHRGDDNLFACLAIPYLTFCEVKPKRLPSKHNRTASATASCPAICHSLAAGCEHGWKKGLPITGHDDQVRFLHVFLEYGKHLKVHNRHTNRLE